MESDQCSRSPKTSRLRPVNNLPCLTGSTSYLQTKRRLTKLEPPDVQSTSGPGQPATSSKDSFLLSAVDKASATSHTVSSPSPTTLKPISELWNEAYEELKQKEDRLMKDYEAAMPKDITLMLASTSLTLAAPQVAVVRREQMAALLEKKTAEAKKNAWKLT